ncbi:uncharacterized protein UBRO_07551 [Ustilago bromivora]|uniref:UBX domain-containing protein n=1 Tax=Ustilago bromivora TaxID=307758 RepID=A0A1K0GVX6_9BASI|nr:uncharacterized protein UBRO_07551 [Ustilago bromivora]
MSSTNDNQASASGSTSSAPPAPRVFLPPSASSSPSTSSRLLPLPLASAEDDLKPCAEELRHAFRSTLLGRHGPDAPLLTRALREKEDARLGLHASRNRTFPHVRIRIRFSDRTMLEGDFTETDTIEKIYTLLEHALDEKVRRVGRVIYTTPPKIEYPKQDTKVKGKTLRELGFIPSAVLNIKWDQPEMNANTFPAPLRQELSMNAELLPPPPSFDQQQPAPVPASGEGKQPEPRKDGGKKESKPMPKWLKGIANRQDREASRKRLPPNPLSNGLSTKTQCH